MVAHCADSFIALAAVILTCVKHSDSLNIPCQGSSLGNRTATLIVRRPTNERSFRV